MTPKERWLAAARLKPVDRLPFWPKLDGSFPPAQSEPFKDMELAQIHEWIGSDRNETVPMCTREIRTYTSVIEVRDKTTFRTVYATPHGTLETCRHYDALSQSWPPVKYPVETLEDIKVMTEIFADCRVELDKDALEEAKCRYKEFGQNAVTRTGMGKSALMNWVEFWTSFENAHILLMSHPDEVSELMETFHKIPEK